MNTFQLKCLRVWLRAGVAAAFVCVFAAGAAWGQEVVDLPMAPRAQPPAKPQDSPVGTQPVTGLAVGTPNVVVEAAGPGAMSLGLDEAIARGLRENLQVKLATQTERTVRGEILAVGNALLPNFRATAYTNTTELNLAAMGFKASSLRGFGLPAGAIHEIVKVDTTAAQVSLDQILFSVPDYYLYRAAQKASDVVSLNILNTRGGVVQAVGTQYLLALADQAQIANAQALEVADEEVLRQATESHGAGVGTNLDVLRARVQLQTQQQAIVRAENAFAKDKIALTRLIGLPAEQELVLTDAVPYADYAEMPLAQVKALAYERRKDLLALEAQMEVAERAAKAVKFERMPSLAFTGYYGVLGETRGLYHGVFAAQGVLKIPIFEEARFRGETEVAAAQQIALRREVAALRVTIDAQIRASLLDVESSQELVQVARSNEALAAEVLVHARERFAAGVDDNLPVVRAQARLADAQSRLIGAEFQYNQSKLTLARNTGVVESQYKLYLGR